MITGREKLASVPAGGAVAAPAGGAAAGGAAPGESNICIHSLNMYCKSTKFGVLFNLADLALGQKLNRII